MDNLYIGRAEHEEFARRMADEHHRMHVRIKQVEAKTDTLVELTASVESIAPTSVYLVFVTFAARKYTLIV